MIREARTNNLDRLLMLEHLAFEKDRFHNKQLRYLMTKAQSKVLVYNIDGLVLGVLILLWRRNADRARIASVAVQPECRSRVVGAALVRRAEAIVRSKGLKKYPWRYV